MEAKRIIIKDQIIIEEIEISFCSGKNEFFIIIDKTRFANIEEYIATLKELFSNEITFRQTEKEITLYIDFEELTYISF